MIEYQVKIVVKAGTPAAIELKDANDRFKLFSEQERPAAGMVLYTRDWKPWVSGRGVTNSTSTEVKTYMDIVQRHSADKTLEYYSMCDDSEMCDDTHLGSIDGNDTLMPTCYIEFCP